MWYAKYHSVGVRRTGASSKHVFSFGHHGLSKHQLVKTAQLAIENLVNGSLAEADAKAFCLDRAHRAQ